jgi:tetratricopeptide (TPR) repeat protein
MASVRVLVVCLFVLAPLLFPVLARADEHRFERLVTDATTAFGNGEFEKAIELAEEAYSIRNDPQLLYNIARAHEALGNLDRAIEHYRRYLAAPEAKNVNVVKGRILALETQLGERIRLEGERLETKGERESARAAYRKYLMTLPTARDRAEIERRIRDLGRPLPPKAELETGVPETRMNPWPLVTLGAGVLVVGAGSAFAVLSRNKYDDAENARDGERTVALTDDGDRYTDFANVAFVAGGVIVAGGVTWWLLQPDVKRSSPRVGLELGPTSARITGRF